MLLSALLLSALSSSLYLLESLFLGYGDLTCFLFFGTRHLSGENRFLVGIGVTDRDLRRGATAFDRLGESLIMDEDVGVTDLDLGLTELSTFILLFLLTSLVS